ncbi:ComF family protein [Mycobacteroides abscessus]|uniref:Amidophosphoribosyltransferase n=1 Tax=Mycobacteroides abscessus TaxID=36809 RepID=A0ABD7HFK3_9MYCO|nr:amidophosphoribosyltransferase [Mycobacteroides abscessus]RIR12622.1 amidophosphoribosyltransferase [Mycobacteroides abscessus]RIS01591.1 amidophosphoribosyltransferase [Mycobacteroides abscessus]RIT26292.1 amidophosphoribosyltransferase [Mycobacteroides abscessus]
MLEISDTAVSELVVPPKDGQPESCWRCRTWTDRASGECWNCAKNAQKLGQPALPLDVISLYIKESQLRQWLTCYKGRIDGSEPIIPEFVDVVKALIARFFHVHGNRIVARRPFDVITVVPSSSRPGAHPLEMILRDLPLTIPVSTLLRRGPGELDFNKPSRDGFIPIEADSQRVLLIDDVQTTGSRINSAAYALTKAGHQVAGALVLARRVNLGYKGTTAFWENQKAQQFTWEHSPVVNRQLP